MRDRIDPLTPYPLPLLLGRVAREWDLRRSVFDLPAGRFWRPEPGVSLAGADPGSDPATPLGIAAGPHTQLAQNLVLGWLGGARSFELKTIQVLDRLEIGRPCIDMETVGYNTEWSQELTLERSVREYAKAHLMLHVLREWPPLRERLGDPGPHELELSVGYDLAGIRSEPVTRAIAGLRDASALLAELREELPPPFAHRRGTEVPAAVVQAVTLSTFHGCPPDEIEAIARHLVDAHDLDVTVKLNPTLLGQEAVREILHGRLGYRELELVPEAFAEDLAPARALRLIEDLDDHARARGRTFGVKLTNTLVVRNHRGRLPGERMYLSGPPLHVLAVELLGVLAERLRGRLRLAGPASTAGAAAGGAGSVPVAFSAGAEKGNFPDLAGLGLAPVTVCSDLLRPGGYGRLAPMLRELEGRMRAAGCGDKRQWEAHLRREAAGAGHGSALAGYLARLRGEEAARYGAAARGRPPKRVDSDLRTWGCVACNLCVSVCPNDAFVRLEAGPALADELGGRAQFACLAELCNECGNCATFCPERGEPFRVKPRLFVHRRRWEAETGPAWLLARDGSAAPGPAAPPAVVPNPAAAGGTDTARLSALLAGSRPLPLPAELLPAAAAGEGDGGE